MIHRNRKTTFSLQITILLLFQDSTMFYVLNKYTLCLSVCMLVCIHTDNLSKVTIVNDTLQVLPVICPYASELHISLTMLSRLSSGLLFCLVSIIIIHCRLASPSLTCKLQICAACLVCCSPRFDHIHVCNPSFFTLVSSWISCSVQDCSNL